MPNDMYSMNLYCLWLQPQLPTVMIAISSLKPISNVCHTKVFQTHHMTCHYAFSDHTKRKNVKFDQSNPNYTEAISVIRSNISQDLLSSP